MKIEWHPAAIDDLLPLGSADQKRIKKAIDALQTVDDARKRLLPYSATLKGFWKLRVGDYRLVCRLENRDGQHVLIIHLAHRSVVYGPRGVKVVKERDQAG